MRFTYLLSLLLTVTCLSAQRGNPAQAGDATLSEQHAEMLRVSSNYKTYKTVQLTFLNAFMSNVQDSISGYTNEIEELNNTIASQAERLEEQTTTIGSRDGEIEALKNEKDSMSLLGLSLDKTTYATIMWAAIIGLLAALLFAIARMRVAVANSRTAEGQIDKLSGDLDQSKRRRLEIEQSLRRQLQDEINKRS